MILNYYTNTEAYAKNCVNKAKPKLHCNGKCQMMKKMQAEEKKDQEAPERRAETKLEVVSVNAFFYNLECSYKSILTKATAIVKDGAIIDISYAFFHPPQA